MQQAPGSSSSLTDRRTAVLVRLILPSSARKQMQLQIPPEIWPFLSEKPGRLHHL